MTTGPLLGLIFAKSMSGLQNRADYDKSGTRQYVVVCVKLTSVSPVWICVAEALRRAGQSTTSTIDAIFPLRYAARTDPAIFSKHEMSTISTLGKVAVLEGKWDVKARSYPTYSR